jgi:sialic acid synthase SpsE
MIRCIDKAKGISLPKPFTKEEIRYREFQKKSIVLSKNISKGSIITSDDIAFMRAEKLGLPPNEVNLVIGKKVLKDLKAYELILLDDIS